MATKSPQSMKGQTIFYGGSNKLIQMQASQEKNQLNVLMRQSVCQMSPLPRPVVKVSPALIMQADIKREAAQSAVVMRTPNKNIERQSFLGRRNDSIREKQLQSTMMSTKLSNLPEILNARNEKATIAS